MKKLLVTAFEPFGGDEINASLETLKRLDDVIAGFQIVKLQVPVVFEEAGGLVISKAEEIGADAVLSLGQAAGRAEVTPEYVAINLRNARIPDNAGRQPSLEPIDKEGPAAFFATLPVFEMANAINGAGVPGNVSYSAGTYVCNDLFYTVMKHFDRTGIKAGFIHVPGLQSEAEPGQHMTLDDMIMAVTAAIKAI
ncbi:MAG: pyroglutamyl-peptidase I [Lachnospiraceae bacterium]|nr:pyroglutamyl-peptidase I [Lachnospiraceae bacterium]